MSKARVMIFLCIVFVLESCTYRYCHTYQPHHWKRVREVALKNKKKNFKKGYSIYGRGYSR